MVGLLDLPLELREPILLDVILDTTQKPPDDPRCFKGRGDFVIMDANILRLKSSPSIFARPLQRHAMPLLHVNQQIRDEVIDLMPRKLDQQIDDASADVVFVDKGNSSWNSQFRLCATWLSAPFPTNHRNTVHAQIRYFQVPTSKPVWHLHPKAMGNDCQSWVDSQTAGLLLSFLANTLVASSGSAAIFKVQRTAGECGSQTPYRTIQNLVLDILLEPDQQDSLETRIQCSWCADAHGDISNHGFYQMIPSGKRAALIFARTLRKQLLKIFDALPKYWGSTTFPCIVFECIGTIHLKVHGRLFESFDLSQILANLPRSEEWTDSAFSRAEFYKWKRAVEEKRRSAGFKVVRPSVQEHELAGSASIIASILAAKDESLVQEVTTPSDDITPSSGQPARDEVASFPVKAVFIEKDGTRLPGNATFFCSTFEAWSNMQLAFYNPPLVDVYRRTSITRPLLRQASEEQPRCGEVVLFKGESIIFHSDKTLSTINSGHATFYGRAEEAGTEQSGSIEIDSQAGDRHDGCDNFDT